MARRTAYHGTGQISAELSAQNSGGGFYGFNAAGGAGAARRALARFETIRAPVFTRPFRVTRGAPRGLAPDLPVDLGAGFGLRPFFAGGGHG